MEIRIPDDASYEYEVEVTKEYAARGIGLKVEVLSTPSLVLLMEIASHKAIEKYLPEGYTTVGGGICMKHLKPTPVGDKVRVLSKLTRRDGKKLDFEVVAYDSSGKIGEGEHRRYIVKVEYFESKIH